MAKPGKLTDRQQRFVTEYLVDLNGTQAAIRAGYSEKTAQPCSARLLSKAMVKDAVASGLAKRSERVEITQDYVLTGIRSNVERCQGEDGYNPQAALKGLELLGRHLAMFTDKTINKTTIETMTDAEIDQRLATYGDNAKGAPGATHRAGSA